VEDQVLGDVLLDLAKKTQKLLVAMARLALGDHLSGCLVQRREQGCGAVTDVVVGDALGVPQAHGQQRLSPCQNLKGASKAAGMLNPTFKNTRFVRASTSRVPVSS